MRVLLIGAALFLLLASVMGCEEELTPPGETGASIKEPPPSSVVSATSGQSIEVEFQVAVALEEGAVPLADFREGARVGLLGSSMTDGRVEVTLRQVLRTPYFNPHARVRTANYEYETVFTVRNSRSVTEKIEAIEVIMYSRVPEPIIRARIGYSDKDYNVLDAHTILPAGSIAEFQASTMGREGALGSIGIDITYVEDARSRFWVPVGEDQIGEP